MSAVEEWRAVPGFEGSYEVSDLGRVRSLDRVDSLGRQLVGLVLQEKHAGQSAYSTVCLCSEGRRYDRYIHYLVLLAFVGPRPAGMQACHNYGKDRGNALWNLRYDTVGGNQLDRVGQGTDQFGERNPQAKLTPPEVRYIRASQERGVDLAARFGVSPSLVSVLKSDPKRWPHV